MTVNDVYTKYKIMPLLRLHQLRVAAVAKAICESLPQTSDFENIISACLVHDMGNIIKYDLSLFKESTQPEGLKYWQSVKKEFVQKYGNNEHLATAQIATDLNLSVRTLDILNSVGFSKASLNLKQGDLAKMIVCYADQRVTPKGVASLSKRINDGKTRFKTTKNTSHNNTKEFEVIFKQNSKALFEMEEKIFENSKIKPEDITDSLITPALEYLQTYILT